MPSHKEPFCHASSSPRPIPAVVLLRFLLTAAQPASAKLKTSEIHFVKFFNKTSDIHKLQSANSTTSSIGPNAFQLTLETKNVDFASFTNQFGRILYKLPFKLWEGRSDAYSDRVASFNNSFLVNMYGLKYFPTPSEGMAFVVAPDLKILPNSSSEYLGLTNAATDGNASNHLIAVELDTFKQDFDSNSHHVKLNINSVRHNGTTSLTILLDYELVAPLGIGYYFNVWIEYEGSKKVLFVGTSFYRSFPSVVALPVAVMVVADHSPPPHPSSLSFSLNQN